MRAGRGAFSRAGWARRLWAWLAAAAQQIKFRRRLRALLRPASSARLADSSAALNVISASAKQVGGGSGHIRTLHHFLHNQLTRYETILKC